MHTVTVDLKVTDLLRAQFQMLGRMRALKILFVTTLVYGAYTVFTSEPRVPLSGGIGAGLARAILITVSVFLVIYLLVAGILLLRLRRRRDALERHEFALTDAGLLIRSQDRERLVPWGAAANVFRTASFFFVRLAPAGFYAIPRRAFTDRAADAEFWKGLQPLVAKTEN